MSSPDNEQEKVLDGDKYEKRAISVMRQHGATILDGEK